MTDLRQSPGYQRLLHETIDHVEARGRWPKTKTLRSLSMEEVRGLQLALRTDCLRVIDETTVAVNIERLCEREFSGDQDQMEAHFTAWANRPIRAHRAAFDADAEQLRAILLTEQPPAASHLLRQIEARRGWLTATLRSAGAAEARRAMTTFLEVARMLPCDPPERFRTLARKAGLPSKALDPGTPLHRRLTRYLTEPDHDEDPTEGDEEAAWRAAGVTRNMTSIHALIYGQLRLTTPRGPFMLPPAPNYAALLTWEILESSQVEPPLPRYAVFIENETSFNEARDHAPPDVLLVFTEGYPNRAIVALCERLASAKVRLFHWGDIDGGGMRTLRVLKSAGPVTPVLMNEAALEVYAPQTLDEGKRRAIRLELQHWPPGPERDLMERCLNEGRWIEQESIPARAAMDEAERLAKIGDG